MSEGRDDFDFEHSVLKSRKYLVVNKIGLINGILKKIIMSFVLIQKGLFVSIFLPVVWTIIPAIINLTKQEWLYGVFFLGAFIGLIYTKFVMTTKSHALNSLVNSIESSHHGKKILKDRFSRIEKIVSFGLIKESREKTEHYASLLCEGNLRDDIKFRWIEPITGLLVILYFFNNPEITIISREYLNFLFAVSFVTIDIFVSGFFSSFSEFIEWIPAIKTEGSTSNVIIVGMLRFFIVLFLTKLLIEKFGNIFSTKIWFEGNPVGLQLYIKKYLNSFSDMEGSLVIYDFGIREEFGRNRASLLLNQSVRKQSEVIIEELLN